MVELDIGLGIDMLIRFILTGALTESTMFRTYVIRVSPGLVVFCGISKLVNGLNKLDKWLGTNSTVTTSHFAGCFYDYAFTNSIRCLTCSRQSVALYFKAISSRSPGKNLPNIIGSYRSTSIAFFITCVHVMSS